jgi:hypothetical protein
MGYRADALANALTWAILDCLSDPTDMVRRRCDVSGWPECNAGVHNWCDAEFRPALIVGIAGDVWHNVAWSVPTSELSANPTHATVAPVARQLADRYLREYAETCHRRGW